MKTLTVTDVECMRVGQFLDIAAIFWAQREPRIGVYVTEAEALGFKASTWHEMAPGSCTPHVLVHACSRPVGMR